MAKDFWPTLHQDPYALARLRKSCELADVKPGMSLLDVGCHQGEARQFFKDIEYVGIDTLTGHEIDGGFNLNRKFDRIICLEVLEHLKNPRATIESICNHLYEDGILIVSLPNEASVFHRFRCLLGLVDAECFSDQGKHLHLPSLKQCRSLLSLKSDRLKVVSEEYYISRSAAGSRQEWVGRILSVIPESLLQYLADRLPSLFARGFIFVCKKK